jgi:hypothetical protein
MKAMWEIELTILVDLYEPVDAHITSRACQEPNFNKVNTKHTVPPEWLSR